jgi:hypothetical protein
MVQFRLMLDICPKTNADRHDDYFLSNMELEEQPVIRGIEYTQTDVDTLVRQLCKDLHRQHTDHHTVVTDFDLLAVFLMQEMGPKHHIRLIVRMVINQFGGDLPPQNALQSQLLHAAQSVKITIHNYDEKITAAKPFCLRYPTYSDVLDHSILMQGKCALLTNEHMVVLLDESGICIGVGVPPISPHSPVHLPPAVRQMCMS